MPICYARSKHCLSFFVECDNLSLDIPSDLIFCDSYTRKTTGRAFFEDDCNEAGEQRPAVDSGYSMIQSVLRRLLR